MVKANILVVDSDEGFGFMLKEGLQNSGHYTAKWVHSGSDALQAVVEQAFDLVIIDMALTDMPPAKLVQAIREAKNGIRIMMIPLIGQDLPDKIKALEINGILTKPFFVGDLPDLIDQATGQRKSVPQARPTPVPLPPAKPTDPPPTSRPAVESPATPPPVPVIPKTASAPVAVESAIVVDENSSLTFVTVPQETIRYLRANETEILRLLDDLNREVRAEAILLIAGLELIAQAGMLSRVQCRELTLLVAQSSQAAAQAASFLGERAGRFAQSLHEGSEYRLYSLSLGEGILLSLALSSNVPLGMIRHQCRQTADQLAKYIIER
jgi:DNA-binding response OmpR family regulator/predicted regulator of Ras-like GTPase activity (Roadblock/LC7/MglB family)